MKFLSVKHLHIEDWRFDTPPRQKCLTINIGAKNTVSHKIFVKDIRTVKKGIMSAFQNIMKRTISVWVNADLKNKVRAKFSKILALKCDI